MTGWRVRLPRTAALGDWARAHPLAVDAVFGAVVTVLVVTGYYADHDPVRRLPIEDWWSYVLALVSLVPLVWRRSRPLTVLTVVGIASTVLSAGGYDVDGVGPLIALYSVAAYSPQRWARLALAGTAVGVSISLVAHGDSRKAALFASNGIFFVTAWLLGRNMHHRRAYVAAVEARADRLEREREANEREAVAVERARIARELHDVVAHHVSVMVVQAAAVRRTVGRDPDLSVAGLVTIEQTGREALTEMRRMLGVLRSEGAGDAGPQRAPQPGLADLDALVEQVRATGREVDVRVEGEPVSLAAGVELTAYRVVQEALTNVIKHAGHARVCVVLRYGRSALDVEVVDDGAGASSALGAGGGPRLNGSGGHGLLGMRERVAMVGGTLRHGPRAGGGYGVAVTIPVETVPA